MVKLTIELPEDLVAWLQEGATREYRETEGHVAYCLGAYRNVLERARTRMERHRTLHPKIGKSSKEVIFSTKSFSINPEVLSSWIKAFPALNVEREIGVAHAWAVANPANAKSNWHRFLLNWLKRAQDRAPRVKIGETYTPLRPAILDEPNGEVAPMPPEIREKLAKLIDGVKMP